MPPSAPRTSARRTFFADGSLAGPLHPSSANAAPKRLETHCRYFVRDSGVVSSSSKLSEHPDHRADHRFLALVGHPRREVERDGDVVLPARTSAISSAMSDSRSAGVIIVTCAASARTTSADIPRGSSRARLRCRAPRPGTSTATWSGAVRERVALARSIRQPHARRDVPSLVRHRFLRELTVALLRHLDRRAAARALEREREQRRARLIDETPHDLVDRLAGRLRHDGPEVFGARVAVLELLQVGVDAGAERLGADVALDHAAAPRPLVVGDRVEAAR
jgi:hypothetical protein